MEVDNMAGRKCLYQVSSIISAITTEISRDASARSPVANKFICDTCLAEKAAQPISHIVARSEKLHRGIKMNIFGCEEG